MRVTYDLTKALDIDSGYDPTKIGMPVDYEDTPCNFITEYRDKVKDKSDILRVLCRDEFLSEKELRLYAVWCARQVQHLMKDERSIKALDVAEAYANGNATREELQTALEAAKVAAREAARDVLWAVRNASLEAALGARDAAKAVAQNSARNAAWAVAQNSARAASINSTIDKQIDKLLEIFREKEDRK